MAPQLPTNLEHHSAPATRLVFVSGAGGFLGRRLCAQLAARGRTLVVGDKTAIDAPAVRDPSRSTHVQRLDFTNESAWTTFLRGATSRDVVVHLAGRLGVREVVQNPDECRLQNVAMTRALVAVLQRLPAADRPRVFAASTSEVYLPQARPLGEGDPVRGIDERGRWAYAASKVECERLLDEALPWGPERAPVHLRFFNVVGPGQDSSQGMVLPTFVEHALAGRPIPVHGDGSAVRTLAHVDDVAETLCALVDHPALAGGPLNVGGTALASVLEIARSVLARSLGRGGIEHVDPKVTVGALFEDIAWREPDLTRLCALGVPVPARSLEDIVADTLERHTALMPRRSECGSRAS